MTLLWFVAAALGSWRVTHLLVEEDGPWNVLRGVRRVFAAAGAARLVACFLCASVWIAVPFAVLISTTWREIVIAIPALSGAAILLERATSANAPATFIEETEESP